MRTIVEPKEQIDKLWGKQRFRDGDTYRMMRYVLRVYHDGNVLLHNVVTGRLVVLDQGEAETLEKLPMVYTPVMEQLVTEHYLVPEEYDEHQQVVNLRKILFTIVDTHLPNEVVSYLILPTTACNARCWYCFEKGVKSITMTEKTANDVVDFIEKHCGGKKITIWWFGGEPTLAVDRIDQICKGLRERHIEYISDISTNGYAFDEDMIKKAKNLWNIRQVTVSVDGTEATFNRIKAFKNAPNSPYQRMMRNIGLLLEQKIAVGLRMNYDEDSYLEFADLLLEARKRFPPSAPLMIYPHQINREYADENERQVAEAWFNETIIELSDLSQKSGFCRPEVHDLPSLSYQVCGAVNGRWFVITPAGDLVCCGEQLGDDQIKGDLIHGVTNVELTRSWKEFADNKRCQECVLFPRCAKMLHCSAMDRCYHKKHSILKYTEEMSKRLSTLQ